MAIGTYEVYNQSGYGDTRSSATSSYYSVGMRFIPSSSGVIVRSVFSNAVTTPGTVKFQIFNYSTGALLTNQTISLTAVSGWEEIAITPVNLTAGTEYMIGFYQPTPGTTATSYDTTASAAYLAGQSTPSGISSSWWGQMYGNTSNAETTMPSTVIADSLMIKLGLDITPPAGPTGVTVTNTPVPNGTVPLVSWTFSGQAKYQMRWRKIS